MKTGERFLKMRIVLAFRFDEGRQFVTEFRHHVSEFCNSTMPCGDVLLLIGEEGLKNLREVSRIGDVKIKPVVVRVDREVHGSETG